MQNIEELYFISEPIDCGIGKLHFIKVKEYGEFLKYIKLLNLQKFEILQLISMEYRASFERMPFIDIIKYFNGEECALYHAYRRLFMFCFKADVFDRIESDEAFEYYRALIRKMNCIPYDPPNPDAEIEKFNQLKKIYNQRKREAVTLESIYTSVWAATGRKPLNLTIYELNTLFNRICMFKDYDTSILFRTVSNEVMIEPWYKSAEHTKEKMTLDDFSQKALSNVSSR